MSLNAHKRRKHGQVPGVTAGSERLTEDRA